MRNRYFRIYVDEYQDSDKDMHEFFMYVNEKMNIPFFIVGDIKQSIYEWRGGYPDGFKNLLHNDKYTSFKLLHNFRSNEQIQNYASIFIEDIRDNYQKCKLNGEVQGCFYSVENELIQYIGKWLRFLGFLICLVARILPSSVSTVEYCLIHLVSAIWNTLYSFIRED